MEVKSRWGREKRKGESESGCSLVLVLNGNGFTSVGSLSLLRAHSLELESRTALASLRSLHAFHLLSFMV